MNTFKTKYGEKERVHPNSEKGKYNYVQKAFKESCDINHILKKYQQTGVLPVNKMPALYDDYSNTTDYQEGLNILIKAQAQFDNLPSDVRKKFQNDPIQFLEFVGDPNNKEEMYKLGLAVKPLPEKPKEVIIKEPIKSE